jgi:hypothetical protein
MHPDSSSISVAIAPHSEQRWDDLRRAMESTRRQTTPPQTIVVDHNWNLLECLRGELVDTKRIRITKTAGHAAFRCATHAARGEIVAFLNDDTSPSREWLERLLAHNGIEGAGRPALIDGTPLGRTKGAAATGYDPATRERFREGRQYWSHRSVRRGLGGFATWSSPSSISLFGPCSVRWFVAAAACM